MTRLLLVLLTVGASVLQLGVVPAFTAQPAGVPLLPIALIAAWGVVRDPSEVLPALPAAAVVLGVASQERVGWYLFALLPVAIGLSAASRSGRAVHRLAWVPITAAGGAVAYLALLFVVDGHARALPAAIGDLTIAAGGTAFLAVAMAAIFWPFRGHARGLFG